MPRRVPDTTKLRTLTGWAPTYSLDQILAETIAEARLELAVTSPALERAAAVPHP